MKKILGYLSIVLSLTLAGLLIYNIFGYDDLDEIYDSIVYIESIDDETIRSGSGFVYKVEDNKNYIITSYHVIEDYTDIYVYNNNKVKIKANILNYDEYTDIAILTIEDDLDLNKIDIGNSDKVSVADEVYAVGTPIDISNINTISSGKIISINKNITVETTHGSSNLNTIQVNTKIDNGNSGGPLLNKKYEVIGMMFIKENDEVSYALPINFIMDIVEKLENNELERPNLGAVMCNSTNNEVLNEYGIIIDDVAGVVSLELNENYPLYNAGLQKGDIITKFNGVTANNVNILREELYKKEKGNVVDLEYYRNNQYYKIDIQL